MIAMVIVFCIEPVGTLTACTMKVMPKQRHDYRNTADSKYSRKTDFGGPLVLFPAPASLRAHCD